MAPSRQRVVMSDFIPGPTFGWNTRDSLATMDPKDAVQSINWFPDTDLCRTRNGYTSYATGFTGNVETLMEYAGLSSSKFFAAANNSFYDISIGGAIGAASDTGHTNNRWQWCMFTNSGGTYLYCVNGADAPRYFDGATWTNAAITGVTQTNLIDVLPYQQRLWFIEKNTLNVWFLGVEAITGAATKYNLRSYARRGGYLVGMGTWSRDAGSGPQEFIYFVTSEGEVIEYSGTDPTSATTFALTGSYKIGRVVGSYRSTVRFGADSLIMCEDGVYPLSKLLITGQTRQDVAISDKIRGAFSTASVTAKTYFGWQGTLYPRGRMLIFNVPVANNSTSDQYVMNTITGAWCRFTNQNAFCWSLYAGNLYFGANGTVYKADTGFDDNGADIQGTLQPAYNYYGDPNTNKLFTLCRPIFISSGNITPAITMCVDFNDQNPSSIPSYSGASGSPWDTSPWNTSPWESKDRALTSWQSVGGMGFAGSLKIKTANKNFGLALASYQVGYMPARNLM